jgi:transposase
MANGVFIEPMLPNKPRGVPRVDDRRVLNGIFWVLRSGAPWRDLPDQYGPYSTCYNRFTRWRRAGVWDRIMVALSTTHDAALQMIDTSIVRVHQHRACIGGNRDQQMGQLRRGSAPKSMPSSTATACRCSSASPPEKPTTIARARACLQGFFPKPFCWLIAAMTQTESVRSWRNGARGQTFAPKRNRKDPICFSPHLYPLPWPQPRGTVLQ